MYETIMPPLVQEFLSGQRNVMLFAYGQTGSGKSHSMLGTDECLRRQECSSGWGIIPRVYKETRTSMQGKPHVVTASAIEFHMGRCSCLLSEGKSVSIDADTHMPMGAAVKELSNENDLMELLSTVQANRTSRGTLMNEADDTHGGSSRSHAAIILYLQQVDPDTNLYRKTCFTMIDLAGAERPSKTKEKRFGGGDMIAWYLAMQGKEAQVQTGMQAFIINYELSNLATEIQKSTEAHKRKQKYSPPRQVTTEVIKFVGACLGGSAVTSMLLCLSPANVNGWETWYSLQYGNSVSKLKVPVRKQTPVDIVRAHRMAKRKAKIAADDFSNAPKNKYYETRRLKAAVSNQREQDLEKLMEMLDAVQLL